MNLLSMSNPKLVKNQKYNYLSGILHLAPFNLSGYQVCKNASDGCSKACLNTAGRGHMDIIQQARVRKTKMLFKQKEAFLLALKNDIEKLERKAKKEGMNCSVRLNGTSDLPWERIMLDGRNMFQHFPHLQFYDYTKRHDRKNIPENYHLTFSLAEDNDEFAKSVDMNVAVVFKDVPETFWGKPVYDGDDSDLRFLDPPGHIIGLKAKGKAKKDTTGFVR